MADNAIRAPRSLAEAQRLCEQWAELDGEIAAIEESRDVAIARANSEVDKDLTPLIKRREAIEAKLEPWWKANAAELTKGKSKSAELGGAVMGTRMGRGKVTVAGAIDVLVDKLRKTAWGKKFVRTKHELDRTETAKGLLGKHGSALRQLGVGYDPGAETFFIERTAQAGTQGKVS